MKIGLKIYDNIGQEVKTLVNQYQTKGRYDVNFNADNLATEYISIGYNPAISFQPRKCCFSNNFRERKLPILIIKLNEIC